MIIKLNDHHIQDWTIADDKTNQQSNGGGEL